MKLKKLLKDEKGAVLPLVTIILGLFALGFTALVVDAGILYVERKSMITSADAAALAGAEVFRASKGEADVSEVELVAEKYAIANGADEITVKAEPSSVTLPSGEIDYRMVVKVTVGKNQPLIFARFLGDENTDVKAYAIATWGYVKKSYIGSFVPLFTFDNDYKLNSDIGLHDKLQESNTYGFIDIASGMGDIKKAIAGNTVGATHIYDNYLDGKPGDGESLRLGVEERMKAAQGKTTAEERRKYMIGLVPVIDQEQFKAYPGNISVDKDGNEKLSSKLKLPIKYFAYFEITDVIKQGQIVGSEEALDPENQYTRKGIPQFDYTGKIPANLLNKEGDGADNTIVLGRFTGEIINARTIAEIGDQINPNPSGDSPATYSKLIK